LRIAPCRRAPDSGGLRIQLRNALEQQSVVLRREPGPPRNGLTWACTAAVNNIQADSAADKQCGDRGRMHLSFKAAVNPPGVPQNGQLEAIAVSLRARPDRCGLLEPNAGSLPS